MLKKTFARKFLEFAEEIQDPDFDVSTLEDSEEFDEPQVDVDDNQATISLPQEDDGSAVTVVTPKGTSVSVTESIAKAFLASSWFKPICESFSKTNKLNEGAGGANFAFSTADVNDFYNGTSLDDIIARRMSKSWNDPQGIKNAFGGSVNEDFEEEPEESTSSEEGFFAEDEIPEVIDQPITADLSVEGDKITIDNIEMKDRVEENPELDTPTRDEDEENDEIVVGDPIGEALQAAKTIRKDASISNKVEDAEKPVMKVQTTNGVVDKKKVKEQA